MPTLPSRPPKSVTIGSGFDKIVMHVSQDWYVTNATYAVFLDGTQVGANQSVSAIDSNGNFDTVTVLCNLIAGSHTLQINFLNDDWDGTGIQPPNFHDRNIHVRGITYDGAAIPNSDLFIDWSGAANTVTFDPKNLAPQQPPKSVTLGSGPDSLVFHISQTWYLANASYAVLVDGVQIGANQTVSSIRNQGGTDTVTVLGNFAAGSHTVAVNFLNPANDGTQPAAPNFHIRKIFISNGTFNGVAVLTTEMQIVLATDPHTFTFTKSAAGGIPNNPPASVALGSGVNTIVMHVAQDWYQTNCLYTVAVDGVQIGGTVQCSGIAAQGVFDTVTVKGAFPAGGHSLTVTLLNDDWDGTWGPDGNTPNGHDRNLYVSSVTFNGAAVAGSNLSIMDGTPQSFSFQGATAGGGGGGGGGGDYPVALTNLGITNARKTFSDEFDTLSVSDAGPPSTTWSPWGHGLGDTMNVVNQYNLLNVSNSVVQISYAEGGHRAILASSNGQNGNGFHQKYGYFEARMKLPTSDNMWGAFWLAADDATWSTSPDNYEIDVLEFFTQHINGLRNQYITSEVHDWFITPPGGQLVPSPLWFAQGYDSSSGGDMSADFHTYGMYWDPNLFIFFIDGVEMTRGVPPTQNVPPVYIIFDIEVNTGGSHPDQPVTYPASMYVDWVRVWQLPQF